MAIDFVFGKSYSYVLPVGHEKIPVVCFKNKEMLDLDGFLDLASGSVLQYIGTQYVSLYGDYCPVFLSGSKRVAVPPSALPFIFRINTRVKKRM